MPNSKADLEEILNSIQELADDALDPELSREDVVARVKQISDLASGEDSDDDDDDDDSLAAIGGATKRARSPTAPSATARTHARRLVRASVRFAARPAPSRSAISTATRKTARRQICCGLADPATSDVETRSGEPASEGRLNSLIPRRVALKISGSG
jgi:hypothetical protein